MTKKDFIKLFAAEANMSQKDGGEVLDILLSCIETSLSKGDKKLSFVGWGTWEVKTRAKRTGRNPQTGKAITIPAKQTIKFRAGSQLEQKINK